MGIKPIVSQTSNQKVAIVIGGSYSIGRATVVALAKEEERAKVVIAAHVTFKLRGFVNNAVHIHLKFPALPLPSFSCYDNCDWTIIIIV